MTAAGARPDSLFEQNAGEATFTRLESGEVPVTRQRRQASRFAVELDVSLGSDHNFYAGFVENISEGGVFIATHVLKPIGDRLELTIRLPDRQEPVRGVGEVRWIRQYCETSDVPPGMGVRFVELAPGSREAVEHFLAHREPMFYDD